MKVTLATCSSKIIVIIFTSWVHNRSRHKSKKSFFHRFFRDYALCGFVVWWYLQNISYANFTTNLHDYFLERKRQRENILRRIYPFPSVNYKAPRGDLVQFVLWNKNILPLKKKILLTGNIALITDDYWYHQNCNSITPLPVREGSSSKWVSHDLGSSLVLDIWISFFD